MIARNTTGRAFRRNNIAYFPEYPTSRDESVSGPGASRKLLCGRVMWRENFCDGRDEPLRFNRARTSQKGSAFILPITQEETIGDPSVRRSIRETRKFRAKRSKPITLTFSPDYAVSHSELSTRYYFPKTVIIMADIRCVFL